jgi:hypothetical protein
VSHQHLALFYDVHNISVHMCIIHEKEVIPFFSFTDWREIKKVWKSSAFLKIFEVRLGYSSVVEHFPTMTGALGLIPSAVKMYVYMYIYISSHF